jgi:phage baseplate assembly protein gpV
VADPIARLSRELEALRRQVALVRKVLVRLGTVQSVNTATCNVVVQFTGEDATGAPSLSFPIPWFQRGSEHRPPSVGDHALVVDPSLGNGAAVAIVGWPSTAKPSPGADTTHVLYSGSATCKVSAPLVELGVAPTDFAALAARVDAELARVWDTLTDASIVPAPASGPDAGETGLLTLKTAAAAAKAATQTVAATQVKVK